MKKALRYTLNTLCIIALCPVLLWCVGLWVYQPISLLPTLLAVAAWVVARIKGHRAGKHIFL